MQTIKTNTQLNEATNSKPKTNKILNWIIFVFVCAIIFNVGNVDPSKVEALKNDKEIKQSLVQIQEIEKNQKLDSLKLELEKKNIEYLKLKNTK